MSEQIRIEYYIESDTYNAAWISDPIFYDVQRETKVEGEFLIGKTIERVEQEGEGELLLTLKEKGGDSE